MQRFPGSAVGSSEVPPVHPAGAVPPGATKCTWELSIGAERGIGNVIAAATFWTSFAGVTPAAQLPVSVCSDGRVPPAVQGEPVAPLAPGAPEAPAAPGAPTLPVSPLVP